MEHDDEDWKDWNFDRTDDEQTLVNDEEMTFHLQDTIDPKQKKENLRSIEKNQMQT